MPVDFACCECGRVVTAVALERPPAPPFCFACLNLPGWFRNDDIRESIDDTHDGREPLLDVIRERPT